MLAILFAALSVLAGIRAALGCALWPLAFVGAFVGTYVGLLILLFAVIYLMTLPVDLGVPQQRVDRVYRRVTLWAIDLVVTLMRVRITTRGLEQAPEGRFLLVCNHLNDVDPAILMKYFPQQELAFISKRENEQKFILGKFMHRLLCQSINRENDREALRTILNCVRILKEDIASVGVFPEGWVSLDRKLHPFRPGVFKIAQKAGVPIVVCTLRDTHTVLPAMRRLRPSHVQLHLVGVVQPQEYQGRTTVDIARQIHRMMADDLGPELVLDDRNSADD